MHRTCLYCGDLLTGRKTKYCSSEHLYKYTYKRKSERKTCLLCDKKLEGKRRKFCSLNHSQIWHQRNNRRKKHIDALKFLLNYVKDKTYFQTRYVADEYISQKYNIPLYYSRRGYNPKGHTFISKYSDEMKKLIRTYGGYMIHLEPDQWTGKRTKQKVYIVTDEFIERLTAIIENRFKFDYCHGDKLSNDFSKKFVEECDAGNRRPDWFMEELYYLKRNNDVPQHFRNLVEEVLGEEKWHTCT